MQYLIKNPLTVLESSFLSWGLYGLTSALQPYTRTCLKLGFLPVNSSYVVFHTDLLETWFRIYTAVFKASPNRNSGRVEWLIMLLTISIKVWLRISATLFCWGVPSIVYWASMPCSCRNKANRLGFLPVSVYLPPAVILTSSIGSYPFDCTASF